MLEAYIYGGLRTPFGRHAGALSRVRPDDLLACVVKEVVARSGFAPEMIDFTQSYVKGFQQHPTTYLAGFDQVSLQQ